MVLAKDAAKIATTEEYAAASVVTLKTGLFAKMRCDRVDNNISANQACSSLLKAIDSAEPRTEIAIAQVCIRGGAFL